MSDDRLDFDGPVMRGRLPARLVRGFITAGRAIFTVRNARSGNRFTYKVEEKEPAAGKPVDAWYVKALTGPDNGGDYRYIGLLTADRGFIHTAGSKVGSGTPCFLAFAWLWRHVNALPDYVEVWHEGRCGRCGRRLTVPESVARGLGPECAEFSGPAGADRDLFAGDES